MQRDDIDVVKQRISHARSARTHTIYAGGTYLYVFTWSKLDLNDNLDSGCNLVVFFVLVVVVVVAGGK